MRTSDYLNWWDKVTFVISKYPIKQNDLQSFYSFHRFALSNRCYADVKKELNKILIEEYKLSDKDKKSIEE